MAVDFWIKKGNLLPIVTSTLRGDDELPVSLTGATVTFLMSKSATGTAKVNAAAVAHANQTTNKGECTYTWTGTDTDTKGDYKGEFKVVFPSGKPQTFPNDGYLLIRIVDDLG